MKKLSVFLLCALLALGATGALPVFAETGAEENVTYEVVEDTNGDFLGINFTQEWTSALNVRMPSADTFQQTANGLGVIAINFPDPIAVAESTGFAVSLKAAAKNLSPRFFLEDTEGNRYLMYVGGNIEYPFIAPDGTAQQISGGNMYLNLQTALGSGTVTCRWNEVSYFCCSDNTNTMDISDLTLTKLYIALDMRNPVYATNIALHIGELALFTEQEGSVNVEVLFDTRTATYAASAEDTDAQINLHDISKGTLINCPFSITGSHLFQLATDEDYAISLQNFSWKRIGVTFTLNYVNTEGDTVRESETMDYEFGESYSLEAPQVLGYVFVSANQLLSGTAQSNMSIVFTYEPQQFTLTVQYVDTDGNEIREPTQTKYGFQEIYTVDVPEIDGYEYVEMSGRDQGTVMRDVTITITYEKLASGGCNSVVYTVSAGAFAVILLAGASLVLFKRKGGTNR